MVTYNGDTYVARHDKPYGPPLNYGMTNPAAWCFVAQFEPHPVGHAWHPEDVMFPLSPEAGLAGPFSDPTPVCSDCWEENNFKYAFDSAAHTYVIQEML